METFDSGDKIFYTYQATGTMKDSAFQAGENKYQITGGTGKMKGIKGSGTCKTTGTADGGWTTPAPGIYNRGRLRRSSKSGEKIKRMQHEVFAILAEARDYDSYLQNSTSRAACLQTMKTV